MSTGQNYISFLKIWISNIPVNMKFNVYHSTKTTTQQTHSRLPLWQVALKFWPMTGHVHVTSKTTFMCHVNIMNSLYMYFAPLTLLSFLMSCFNSVIFLFNLLFVLVSLSHFSLWPQNPELVQDPLSGWSDGVENDVKGVSAATRVAELLGVLGVGIGSGVSVGTNGISRSIHVSPLSSAGASVAPVSAADTVAVATAGVVTVGAVSMAVNAVDVSAWNLFFLFAQLGSNSDRTSRLSYKERTKHHLAEIIYSLFGLGCFQKANTLVIYKLHHL